MSWRHISALKSGGWHKNKFYVGPDLKVNVEDASILGVALCVLKQFWLEFQIYGTENSEFLTGNFNLEPRTQNTEPRS